MGSTGHGYYQKSRTGNVNSVTFDIADAINFKGRLPERSGMYPPANNRITLKIPTYDKDTALFQFRLNRDNTELIVYAYKDGINEQTAHVNLSAREPSLDALMRFGKNVEKKNAMKIRDLMRNTKFSEDKFYDIVDKLVRAKGGR